MFLIIKFQSRVLAARGFKEAKEDKETKRMQEEIRQMKESLENITKLLEKKKNIYHKKYSESLQNLDCAIIFVVFWIKYSTDWFSQMSNFYVFWMQNLNNSSVFEILNLWILSINRLTWRNLMVSWPLSLWGLVHQLKAQYEEEFMSGAGSILPSGAVLPSYPEIPKSFQSREDIRKIWSWVIVIL